MHMNMAAGVGSTAAVLAPVKPYGTARLLPAELGLAQHSAA